MLNETFFCYFQTQCIKIENFNFQYQFYEKLSWPRWPQIPSDGLWVLITYVPLKIHHFPRCIHLHHQKPSFSKWYEALVFLGWLLEHFDHRCLESQWFQFVGLHVAILCCSFFALSVYPCFKTSRISSSLMLGVTYKEAAFRTQQRRLNSQRAKCEKKKRRKDKTVLEKKATFLIRIS